MTSQNMAASSRLTQMQMRFQQKQLLEREQKRIALTGTTEENNAMQAAKTIGIGKVRQMFDERRRGFGIDRSHPLKPLLTTTPSETSAKTTTFANSKINLTAGNAGSTYRTTGGSLTASQKNELKSTNNTLVHNRSKRTDSVKQQSFTGVNANTKGKGLNQRILGASTKSSIGIDKFSSKEYLFNFEGMDSLENETFPNDLGSVSMDNILTSRTLTIGDQNNNCKENNKDIYKTEETLKPLTTNANKNLNEHSIDTIINNNEKYINNEKHVDNDRTACIKLKPIVVKKSPRALPNKFNKTNTENIPSSTDNNRLKSSNKLSSPPLAQKSRTSVSKTVAAHFLKDSIKTAPKINSNQAQQQYDIMATASQQVTPEDMGVCRYCQRHFVANRLAKHEEVCKKMANTKRKVFDVSKYRVQGTEAEQFQKRASLPLARITHAANAHRYNSLAAANNLQMQPNPAVKKNNWRKKHEEFIRAIREAKKVQAYIASGGKLSDLPPPPPSENPDYIQCPHCLRRFNEAAAERHIPKCANMKHNKPKPGAGPPGNKR